MAHTIDEAVPNRAPAPPTLPSLGASAQQRAPQPIPPTSPEEEEQFAFKWKEFLARPEVKAGLLQFAINVFQPTAPGQTQAGKIGRAVAGGGQAIGRVRTSRTEREEAKRKAGLEERRVATEEEGITVRREEIAGREKVSAERSATLETVAAANAEARKSIADEGLDAHMERLKLEVGKAERVAEGTRDSALLTSILKDEVDQYKACLAGAPVGSDICTPPTTSKILRNFRIFKGVIKNKGPIPDDGTIKDEEFIEILLRGTESEKARARAFMGLMSETQRDRIEAAVSGKTVEDLPPDLETAPPVEPTPPRQRRPAQESQRVRRERARRERQAEKDAKAGKRKPSITREERRATGRLPR